MMNMRKRVAGYISVESSFIMPCVMVILALIIYWTFYMYNRCVLYQDCYIAALRGAQLAHEDKKKILSETELAIMKLLENQLYQYQKEPEVVVSDSMISVKASNRIDITVPQIIGGKNNNLISNREADSKIINPSTLIRNVY